MDTTSAPLTCATFDTEERARTRARHHVDLVFRSGGTEAVSLLVGLDVAPRTVAAMLSLRHTPDVNMRPVLLGRHICVQAELFLARQNDLGFPAGS